MDRGPLGPVETFGGAHHIGVFAGIQCIAGNDMGELVEKQRRDMQFFIVAFGPLADQPDIGRFQRRGRQQPVTPADHEAPVLARIGIDDPGDIGRCHPGTRRGEQLGMQGALIGTGLFRRHQFGPGEIGLQIVIRDHKPATGLAVQHQMSG